MSGSNSVATEVFTRKSIGMPVKTKSYDELLEIDQRNFNTDDFFGKYFKFMSWLTGKKPLSEKAANKKSPSMGQAPVEHIKAFESLKDNKNATTNLLEIYGSNTSLIK